MRWVMYTASLNCERSILNNVPIWIFVPPLKSIYLVIVMDSSCLQTMSIICILGHTIPTEFEGFVGFLILLPMTFNFQAPLKSLKNKTKNFYLQSVNLFSCNHFFLLFYLSFHTPHNTYWIWCNDLPVTLSRSLCIITKPLKSKSYLLSWLPFP